MEPSSAYTTPTSPLQRPPCNPGLAQTVISPPTKETPVQKNVLAMGSGACKSLKPMAPPVVPSGEETGSSNVAVMHTKQIEASEAKIENLTRQIQEMHIQLEEKEAAILRLQREVHKLKSVLQQATSFSNNLNATGDFLSSIQESHGMPGQSLQAQHKKQGVSGESSEVGQTAEGIQIQRYDKDFRSKQLIKEALLDNDFLKNLEPAQVREVVDSMYSERYKQGCLVVREGDAGRHLYVSAEGEFEVLKEGKILGRMGPGKAFGELAILYNCTRTASIRVITQNARVWVLDRRAFQQIMMRSGLQRREDALAFLRSVPLLRPLNSEQLAKLADVLEVEFYSEGTTIVRQGSPGDTFFILSGGRVKITQLDSNQDENEIRKLGRGDYFGEQALLHEERRTASVIALAPGAECLTLDRASFAQLIGDLSELQGKAYGTVTPSQGSEACEATELGWLKLEDLEVVATLGVGGFGRVELVHHREAASSFALKCLKKKYIVDTQQQEHVISEAAIMMSCRSPFICRLYRTFRDNKYVYLLLEACLGGEVWSLLRDRGSFDDPTARFVTACVTEAIGYLHSRSILYRDLKPENLVLDARGYAKLVDFGFSKKLGEGTKTWTFCGTPEYVAPEIILNKGHDRAVDYWALGVLIHELLTGAPPFAAADPMKTYNFILRGIDMIDFPPKQVSRAAQSLIKKLCRDSPSERLGYQREGIADIHKHKWFQGFDWDRLRQSTLQSPFTPHIRGLTDASNFDTYPKDLDIPPDEISGWDIEF